MSWDLWIPIAISVSVILGFFFIIVVAVALWEKRPVQPYVKPRDGEDYDPTPAAEAANDDAREIRYRYRGVYHDAKPYCRMRYDFWTAPDDATVALVSGGTVAGFPMNTVSLWSRSIDGQVLNTTNYNGHVDISGLIDQQAWPGLKLIDLVDKHQQRLSGVTVKQFPATDPIRAYFDIRRETLDAQVARGYARYVDDERSACRYTLKGALVFYFLGVWVRPLRRCLRTIGLVRE